MQESVYNIEHQLNASLPTELPRSGQHLSVGLNSASQSQHSALFEPRLQQGGSQQSALNAQPESHHMHREPPAAANGYATHSQQSGGLNDTAVEPDRHCMAGPPGQQARNQAAPGAHVPPPDVMSFPARDESAPPNVQSTTAIYSSPPAGFQDLSAGPVSSVTCSDHPAHQSQGSAVPAERGYSQQPAGIDMTIQDSFTPSHSQNASQQHEAATGWRQAHRPIVSSHALIQHNPVDQGQNAHHSFVSLARSEQAFSIAHNPQQNAQSDAVSPVPCQSEQACSRTPRSREERLAREKQVDVTYKGSPVTWAAFATKYHLESKHSCCRTCMWCREVIRCKFGVLCVTEMLYFLYLIGGTGVQA